MKVRDILEHFLSHADWVDRNDTVDRFILGDPEADIDRCMVTLTRYINANLPGLIAEHLAQNCPLQLVGGAS